jgi:NAD+ kinase
LGAEEEEVIVHDAKNPRAVQFREELEKRLPDGPADGVVVVMGGDGFLLQTAATHGFDRTYLGLNAGHLGFLLNDVEDWDKVADALRRGAWTRWTFPTLETRMTLADGEVLVDRAINDVYLERMTGQTARLALSIDGHVVVDRLVADGIIFSTALGSTAYQFSAGGAPCHPSLHVIAVTPICPHLPRLSPIVLPATARSTVDVQMPQRRPVRCVADGREVGNVRRVEVATGGEATLAFLEGHDFTSRLIRKLLHP